MKKRADAVVVLKHHPMSSIKHTNPFYQNQRSDLVDRIVIEALPDGDIFVENGEVVDHCGMLI